MVYGNKIIDSQVLCLNKTIFFLSEYLDFRKPAISTLNLWNMIITPNIDILPN